MSTSELEAQVARFGQNESCVDKWVNGTENEDYTTSDGRSVPTLPNIARQMLSNGSYYKSYETLALANQDISNIPLNVSVKVLSLEDGGDYYKKLESNTSLTKSPFDALKLGKDYTNSKTLRNKKDSYSLTNVRLSGGTFEYVKAEDFIYNGYVNASGVFVASGSGYKATDYIYLADLSTIYYSLNSSSSTCSIAFYNANLNFISGVNSGNVTTEKTVNPPANSKFIRVTNTVHASPYVNSKYTSQLSDPSLLKQSSLTIEPSTNLAKTTYIVEGSYVNTAGTISTGSGWKYIKIPVLAGESYTFGNFLIDSAGYYCFQNASGSLVAGSKGSFQNNTLPKTLVAPEGASFLLFDIARPTNTTIQHSQVVCNKGTIIAEYSEPVDYVTAIAGNRIAGSGQGSGVVPSNVVVQGSDATLADVIADSLTTSVLIAHLPLSPDGLAAGEAYLDNGFVKVVL